MCDVEMSSDDEDEWLYESIKRYNQLLMFDFENTPKQLQLSDRESLCTVNVDSSGQNEMVELSLPQKMTIPPEREGLVRSCDFKMKSGGYTKSPSIDMKVLYGKKQVFVSEENLQGVAVYQLGSKNSGVISRIGCFGCKLMAPRLSYNKGHTLVLATTDLEQVLQMDTQEGRVMQVSSGHQQFGRGHGLRPEFVSPNVVSLCNIQSGAVDMLDMRSRDICCTISPDGAGVWNIASSFLSSAELEDTTRVGLISALGRARIYDLRNTRQVLCQGHVNTATTPTPVSPSSLVLCFCPVNPLLVSLSGFSDYVYVCESSSESLRTIFVHDGHAKQQGADVSNYVVSHLWYDSVIISASQSKSVHCWQFSNSVIT